MGNKMAEEKGYIHDKLIIKCQINPDQLDKTVATIRNESKIDKLLSNIIEVFPFLQQLDKSDWTICIKSQVIDKNDMHMVKFKSILSTIRPMATIDIVRKTRTEPVKVKNKQVKITPKYLINVDFKGNKFIHKIYEDKDIWTEQIFNNLKSDISQQFHLRATAFNLYGDGDVSVENIDDIIEAFDELDSDDSDDNDDSDIESEKTIPTVNIIIKVTDKYVEEIKEEPVQQMKKKPDISVLQNSDTMISLGRRLKLLSECIAYNKYTMENNDSKLDLEDEKSELERIPLEYILNDLKEIGLVEGYDENSPVIKVLNDISEYVSNNNLTLALKKINNNIGEVMPFDYEEFFELFKATQVTKKRLRNKVAWVLLGPTGAGKSTSIHYLCGSHFKKGIGGSVIVDTVDVTLQNKDIRVGESVIESQTRYIEAADLDLTKYCKNIRRNQPKQVLWVDSPGFEDTAGPEVNMANGIGTIGALKKASKVKVIITFKEAHLDSKFKVIRNIATNMGKAINNLEQLLDKAHGSPITGFLTKSKYGTESANKLFMKAYNAQEHKDEDSNHNALFKALVYKLGTKGSIYEIKIDVDNIQKNEKERISIIQSLVENTGYINTPDLTFKEFISESSLNKLKQQINKSYHTIQNILDNDKYFENPKYIKYIIDTLNILDTLKNIIKNAGGNYVESKLDDCISIFKTKWNNKILKGNNILGKISIKTCRIKLLQKKLADFDRTKMIMEENKKVICKWEHYEKLKDTNCLDEGLHECFNTLYEIVKIYLENIRNKLKADDSDTDAPKSDDNEPLFINYKDDNDNDKNILLCIEKCCLLYNQYKNDRHIKNSVKNFEKLVEKVIKHLKKKSDSKLSQHINGVSALLFIFSNLSKFYNIEMIMHKYFSKSNNNNNEEDIDDEYDDDSKTNINANKSSKVVNIIKDLSNKLKINISESMKRICTSYSLKVPFFNEPDNNNYINVAKINAILKSQAIKTDDEMRSRENKLISFCEWINKLNDSLCNDINGLNKIVFHDLQIWFNNTQNNCIKWLYTACLDELKACNDLLMNNGGWNDVEKLLHECESLRKIPYVTTNTSQEYFKTLSEFDFRKTALTKEAEQLIDEFENVDNDSNINYDKIIKIANQLYKAGCSKESTEMKQIYIKLKQHVSNLKIKTEAIDLSIEMVDDLIIMQNTMKELDTLGKFVTFMPNIKKDANVCYKILNDQLLIVLNEIELKYDLSKYSTENSINLRAKLTDYSNIKSNIDKNILNYVIMRCELKTLTELISLNQNKITELQSRNKQIEKIMEEKLGAKSKKITEYEKLANKGKSLKFDDELDENDYRQWLKQKGFKSLKQIRNKLGVLNEEAKRVCNKEKEEKDCNTDEINKLNRINNEIQKCVQIETHLMLLQPDKVIEYRTDNNFLQSEIDKLEKLLSKNQNYIFTQKLNIYTTYNALNFLNQCKSITWNFKKKIQDEFKDEFKESNVLSNKYVNEINTNVKEYLKAYGDILESNLNDLIGNVEVKDSPECDLNKKEYVDFVQNTISRLKDCLREFRDISNFDRQMKMHVEEDNINSKRKHIKLLACLFTNIDIHSNVDKYINNIISTHKENILMNFAQWRIQRVEKLPILRFICLSMSSLDRFVSNKDDDNYYRIASEIDGVIAKFGNDTTKQIMPLFEHGSWNQLTQILNALKKAADAHKHGIAQRTYNEAVMHLLSMLNKLMSQTENKLLIEINKDNNINDVQILSLKEGLEKVKNLVETIHPHLNDDVENKVKKEAKALGLLLSDRLKQIMAAAVQSAKKRDFKQCEKRLDNISRLMDYNRQLYIDDNDADDDNDIKNNNVENIDTNDDQDEKDVDTYDSKIVTKYKKMRKDIDAQLQKVLKQVADANKALEDPKIFNPYNHLRLTTLHHQLASSQNEQFRELWVNIYDDIVNAIQSILNKIKERHNKIQMQSELMTYSEHKSNDELMTYSAQQTFLRKIELSVSLFPTTMKDLITTMLLDTKECATGNKKYMEDGFKQFLDQHAWNEVAKNLQEFQINTPKFFQSSRKEVIRQIANIYKEFDNNMKNNKTEGFVHNINLLESYKCIGLCFTTLKYSKNNVSPYSNGHQNKIVIHHIQSTLEQMYKDIEHKFINKCKDIKLSLNGHKSYKYLKDAFCIVIRALESTDKLPQQFAQNMMHSCVQLYKPIERLINVLKQRKNKGLNKNSQDIDPLIKALDELKELNDAEFHQNVRKFIPFMDEKESKENITKLEKDIENIDYDLTVKETKDMLIDIKETISKKGLNKEIIQKNQKKRLSFLQKLSEKCKALIKSLISICVPHFGMRQDEFKKSFIKPCTKRMQKDIKSMQRETITAFNPQKLDTNDLKRANANFEAFYSIKNVFEKEIDDEICSDIKIDEAIEICQNTAKQKVQQICNEIQANGLNPENIEGYIKNCAQNLMNLEYLNQHMNFKTSSSENKSSHEQNELHQHIQESIKKSMNFITTNEVTKPKINLLFNHILKTDSNYGVVFTQQQKAFKASLNKTMNQKFRELGINAIIDNLKQTEKQIIKHISKHLIGIDYDRIEETFNQIETKYNDLVESTLRDAMSFDELINKKIPIIANDAKNIASKAVNSKESLLIKLKNSGINYIKNHFSWLSSNTKSKNKLSPRDCYWTIEMRAAVPELIPYILAVWTLSTASCYYECSDRDTLMRARNAQIVAICSILCLDINFSDNTSNKLINNLVEVGTGEGKSLIMAVTSIVLALLDFDVYCACYSELLSRRDQDAFNDLFMQFNVQKHIQYHTFNKIFESMINDGGSIREITKNIVLSKHIDDIDDEKKAIEQEQKRLLNTRQKILFIDEVDKFFSTDFFGKQYTPSAVIPNKEMKNLILFVWNEYMNNDCKGMTITVQKIESSNQYRTLLEAFNPEWHDLLKESIKDIIDGIRNFKDDSYIVENGKHISYKFSDTYSSKVFYGYRTLFTYLYEFNKGKITDENYVNSKLTWFLKCGSFSYSEIPNDFYSILGVTGTLKSLSKKEHQVIQNSYGVKKYIVMPSLFSKKGKLQYAQNKDIDIIEDEHFFSSLHSTITNYLINDINTIQRPIIVFFKDENTIDYFNEHYCETWRLENRIQLLTPDLTKLEKKTGILDATKPNYITFATEEYGRGIDFKVYDEKLKNKGMHVELTYWPDTLAEEIQIKGRTARQGQKGSFHIILNENEIIDQCKVTSDAIKMHQDNGNVYEWLNKIRDKVFEKQYDEASHYVEELKPIHKDSEQLAISLRSKNIKMAKKQLLLFNKGANIQSAAKLSILIDATGSMGSCLNQCKTVIQKTIPQLVQFLKNNNIDTDSFEIQIIAYRNYNANADNILEFCPFTSNENELTDFIHRVKAKNGWGREEAVEVGFGQLNRQQKKPNIVMLMADAPAHTKNEMIRKRKRYGEAHWKSGKGGIFQQIKDWNEELNIFMTQNPDASVYCFYLVNYAKSNFDQIAKIGNGKSMELDVKNEKESIALLHAALSETILYKMNNGNMEYVNKFRKQTKNRITFL